MTLVWAWLDRVDSSYLNLTVSLNINVMVLNPQSVGGKMTITRGMILTVAQGWIETLAFFLCCSALSPTARDVPKVNCGEITRQKTSRKARGESGTSQFIRVTEQRQAGGLKGVESVESEFTP